MKSKTPFSEDTLNEDNEHLRKLYKAMISRSVKRMKMCSLDGVTSLNNRREMMIEVNSGCSNHCPGCFRTGQQGVMDK
ncbi:MAG: hypothetical protein JEZ03_08615, partial [Bacteroidales bacterium]|nr:hypothetical protein [Bacteroidales bacterium]